MNKKHGTIFDQKKQKASGAKYGTSQAHMRSASPNVMKEAEKEVQKEELKKQMGASAELDTLVENATVELMRIKTFWPFQLFTDELVIDKTKVTIIKRTFFRSAQVRSALYQDITDVILETSIFFATIKIIERSLTEQMYIINFLKRKEALEARKLIQGLCAAVQHAEVNVEYLQSQELVKKAKKIGEATQRY